MGFEKDNIKVNKSSIEEMNRLKEEALFEYIHPLQKSYEENTLKICHLNVNHLSPHFHDVEKDHTLLHADILTFTESYVKHSQEQLKLKTHYSIHQATKHGISLYIKNNLHCVEIPVDSPIEISVVEVEHKVKIITVYHAPRENKSDFLHNLEEILKMFGDIPCVVIGDFNMSIKDASLISVMNDFELLATEPTHRDGGIIDHIYIRLLSSVKHGLHPVYFSDHAANFTIIKTL